jgi:hypothetical protein
MDKEMKEALDVIQRRAANCAVGDRHIVVLDRGWIFAGNLSQDKDTKVYTLTDAVNIRKWTQGGFGLLSKSNPSAMIFAVPIAGGWDE